MSWLVRLEIDDKMAFDHRLTDTYAWHQKLWEDCIQKDKDAPRDFLTRIEPMEGAFLVWILAKRKPIHPIWCDSANFGIKEITPSFLVHRYYAFDLITNPVKTLIKRGKNGELLYQKDANGTVKLNSKGKLKRVQGKRIPLVEPNELRDWLLRKSAVRCRDGDTDIPGGFRLVKGKPLEITRMTENYFTKTDKITGKKHTAFHGGVQFRGVLEVTDQKAFSETYYAGIGSAKSFGFGLLLLAPLNL